MSTCRQIRANKKHGPMETAALYWYTAAKSPKCYTCTRWAKYYGMGDFLENCLDLKIEKDYLSL